MLKYLTNVNLTYDPPVLLDELQNVKLSRAQDFNNDTYNSAWSKGHVPLSCKRVWQTCARIGMMFRTDDVLPLYYVQAANEAILPHKDASCTASLNIVLSSQAAPVVFEGQPFMYTCALLNVGGYEHEVPAHPEPRHVLRFVFTDLSLSYEKLLEKLGIVMTEQTQHQLPYLKHVGWHCRTAFFNKEPSPWALIDESEYQRCKTREGYEFKPVYVQDGENKSLPEKMQRILKFAEVKVHQYANGTFFVTVFPRNAGNLWWYSAKNTFEEALDEVYTKAQELRFIPKLGVV